jgi:OOP family OmpA-OmpF porin
MLKRIAVALVLVLMPSSARAEDRTLPPQLAFLASVIELRDEGYVYAGYSYLEWSEYDFGAGVKARGKLWKLRGTVNGKASSDEEKWKIVKARFLAAGWSLGAEARTAANLQLKAKGVESHAQAGFIDGDAVITMIEVAPNPLKLVLRPPAATPEKMEPDKGEFPYLTAPPGVTLKGGHEDVRPFWVTLPGASKPELVASRSLLRSYARPSSLSNLAFVTAYHEALVKAGWDIISEFNSADVSLTAHYAQHGRNVWANLHQNYGEISFNVADGAADLRADLEKDCHVALYGVLFDFNKATLRPVSDALLERVLALLQKSPSLAVEIQGHTDNVGDADYNQKLSEQRAAAVVKWLATHGVAARRLSSRGYGKTQPVADNGTDEGRAKNRRVEIADPKCKPRAN